VVARFVQGWAPRCSSGSSIIVTEFQSRSTRSSHEPIYLRHPARLAGLLAAAVTMGELALDFFINLPIALRPWFFGAC